jgi:hypothetical protein
VATERLLELGGGRHHEAEPRGLVGELPLQIEKIGARDVRLLERSDAGDGDVGIVVAGRRRLEIRRAVVDSQVRPAEGVGELRGADQGLGLSHGSSVG